MQEKSIIQIIKEGEGLTTEFKRTIDSAFKIAKTIVSFANTSGGSLLVGISDSGAILGVASELAELKKLETATGKLIEPKLTIRIKSILLDGMKVMQVDVDESSDKPHYAVNEKDMKIIYIRVKDKSIPIPKLLMQGETDADLEKLLTSRHIKTLIAYLREQDSVTAKVFSRIINISEKRAERMLHDLAEKQVLLKISRNKPEAFSLKYAK
ncbi:AlbA family DNA-binding domain-containing protein [Dyadobacter fanqingshengii]|uniref:ATP-binding protein n=1 Tax=Dyadobacter fanqingshengii TaxID=2906443 RepID=A0A9X1PDQ6_9BACT|nr:ATP-binding protein [Dyadobacter fanqingshengii]MCF0041813.1 ATP-binding protein [Dyadobacter fanqingshengii]USJ36476.1 ATP-binding protein [Dyadobacter fanqingshengii]